VHSLLAVLHHLHHLHHAVVHRAVHSALRRHRLLTLIAGARLGVRYCGHGLP
jgi:hypothetical protein